MLWKNILVPDRLLVKTWRMRVAFWINKATDTHSEYVLLIPFPQQQRLHENASILRYSDIARLVNVYLQEQLYHVRFPLSVRWLQFFVFFSLHW